MNRCYPKIEDLNRGRRKFYLGVEERTIIKIRRRLDANLQAPRGQASTVTKAFFNGYKWFAAHAIKPEEVMTDNGSEFTAYTSQKAKQTHFFEPMLKIFDIKHYYTLPYHPQTNGKDRKILENII